MISRPDKLTGTHIHTKMQLFNSYLPHLKRKLKHTSHRDSTENNASQFIDTIISDKVSGQINKELKQRKLLRCTPRRYLRRMHRRAKPTPSYRGLKRLWSPKRGRKAACQTGGEFLATGAAVRAVLQELS